MPKIAPSILSADFSRLGEEIKKLQKYADLLHVDVMDGHFVPNITFGPPVVASIRKVTSLPLDVHLMIENPQKYVEAFAAAGADIMTVHVETVTDLHKTINKIKKNNVKAGVVLNPATRLSKVTHILDHVDMVLLMTVNPGFGGQKFIESVLPKIRNLRKLIDNNKLKIKIEVDGGINADTAKKALKAGADILVAGSYIYKSKNPIKSIKTLKNL
jgi:ribulose-phosphate 3-epimerase